MYLYEKLNFLINTKLFITMLTYCCLQLVSLHFPVSLNNKQIYSTRLKRGHTPPLKMYDKTYIRRGKMRHRNNSVLLR